jgi:hypothetical protein
LFTVINISLPNETSHSPAIGGKHLPVIGGYSVKLCGIGTGKEPLGCGEKGAGGKELCLPVNRTGIGEQRDKLIESTPDNNGSTIN